MSRAMPMLKITQVARKAAIPTPTRVRNPRDGSARARAATEASTAKPKPNVSVEANFHCWYVSPNLSHTTR